MIAPLRQNPVATAALIIITFALFWLMASHVSGGVLFWLAAIALWALAWAGNSALASARTASPLTQRAIGLAVPAVFGITLLFLWELVVKGFQVPFVLL